MRLVAGVLLVATTAPAAVVTAPGYLARTIPTPAPVQGGVVRRGNAILVGQGAFGAGGEWIVRLDGAGATVIATGFNSLGGFDLEPDGTLLVVDNGGELAGALTGDTLFAIPDAVGRTSPVAALGTEVLPPGTIPFAQDVLAIPETVLVTDAAGTGAGRVLRVSEEGRVEDFATGLDVVRGIAFAIGGTVFVADGVGAILAYDYFGHPRGVLAAGLSGAFAPVIDRDEATVLVSGGVAADGTGTVVAIAPSGRMSQRARGFVVAGELFFDRDREELLVLDTGTSDVTVICGDVDRDGVCDGDDPCSVETPLASPRLRLGRRLVASGETAVTGALNPGTRGLRLAIDGPAGALVEAEIPSGKSWRRRRHGWTYADRRGGAGGVTRIRLREEPGLLRFVIRGKVGVTPGAAELALHVSLGLDPAAVRRPCAVAVLACRLGSVVRCA